MDALHRTIPAEFINALISIGKHENAGVGECCALRLFDQYMVGTWNEWYPVCAMLSAEDHISLLRGLIFNEKHAGVYAVDSGSSAVWVYRKLEDKISCERCFRIARWILEHSQNPWLPFGNERDRAYFSNNMQKFDGGFDGTLTQRIHLERGKDRSKILHKEAEEKAERLKTKQVKAEEHVSRKRLRDLERSTPKDSNSDNNNGSEFQKS